VVLAWAREYGLGISKFVSYGNGADLNEIDFLRYLAGDEETRVVGLYIESVADGRQFMQAVEECAARKPVVVIKAGRTQSGQRATLSHTGSLAGSDAVYDAALRQCGAMRVHTIEEMFDLCQGFLYVPRLAGQRVAIVTNSGGPGVLAADRAEEVGLEVAEPSPAVKARLAEFLPAHCALKNPIDLTVEGTEEGYRRTLLAVLEEYDAALALNIATPYLDSVPLARGICDAARESGKPVVAAFLPGRIVAEAISYLQEHGVPNFATGERAVAALARMAEYEARPEHGRAGGRQGDKETRGQGDEETRRRGDKGTRRQGDKELPGGGPLLEPEVMAWLRENGLPVPDFRIAPTVEEAVRGCREIGYPAVMKVVSPDILHKSDCGGVVLGIRDDEGALAAFQAIRQAAAGKDFRGVAIYPLIEGGVEVLLGLSRDPQFGPVVAFGLGGIYTEVWHDVALRVAPVTRAEAESMVRQIKSFPLLAGVRGQPPRDLQALAEALVRISWLPFRYPEVGEVDLNPVFLFEEGRGLVVGDARVIRNS
jgi:acetyltransferase